MLRASRTACSAQTKPKSTGTIPNNALNSITFGSAKSAGPTSQPSTKAILIRLRSMWVGGRRFSRVRTEPFPTAVRIAHLRPRSNRCTFHRQRPSQASRMQKELKANRKGHDGCCPMVTYSSGTLCMEKSSGTTNGANTKANLTRKRVNRRNLLIRADTSNRSFCPESGDRHS